MLGGRSFIPHIAQLSISLVGAGGVLDGGCCCGFEGKLHGFRLLTNFGGAWNMWITTLADDNPNLL